MRSPLCAAVRYGHSDRVKIVIAALLVIALVSSAFGTYWSTRPVVTRTEEQASEGLYNLHIADNAWQEHRGAGALGVGLILTTVAGLLALLL